MRDFSHLARARAAKQIVSMPHLHCIFHVDPWHCDGARFSRNHDVLRRQQRVYKGIEVARQTRVSQDETGSIVSVIASSADERIMIIENGNILSESAGLLQNIPYSLDIDRYRCDLLRRGGRCGRVVDLWK